MDRTPPRLFSGCILDFIRSENTLAHLGVVVSRVEEVRALFAEKKSRDIFRKQSRWHFLALD